MSITNTELPIAYQKWFDKFNEIDTLDVSQWKSVHLISFICQKYREHYGIDYTMRMNHTSPSKSYEVWQISKLTQMLTKDPIILKNYISWIFSEKIIKRKKQIKTLAIFTLPENVNEYKWQVFDNQIDRTTPLPENILNAVKDIDNTIRTYGDLAFINNTEELEHAYLFAQLDKIGFDRKILGKIK